MRSEKVYSGLTSWTAALMIHFAALHLVAAAQESESDVRSAATVARLEDTFRRLLDSDIAPPIKRDAAEALAAYGPVLPETPEFKQLFDEAKQDGILITTPWQSLGSGRSAAEAATDLDSARAHALDNLQDQIVQQSPAFKQAAFECREDLQVCRVRNYGWLDCELIMITYMNTSGMRSALQEFGLFLADREFDAVVFFYSGHALQIMGKNYLLPTDVRADTATELIKTAMPIDEILEHLGIVKVRIIILDACRDNPWQHAIGDVDPSLRPGLAEISAAAGTFVAYSTAPNRIAYEGRNRNGFFTGALVQHAATPHLDISDLFARVRRAVIESTGGAQVPWDHSSLTDRFYLAQAPTTAEDFARGAPFGALAISTPFRGRIFLGTSTGISNLDRAVNLALDRCRTFASSCGLKLIAYADECYAAAVDDATFAVGWAKADQREQAEEEAIKECIAAGGRACIPRESSCNWQ